MLFSLITFELKAHVSWKSKTNVELVRFVSIYCFTKPIPPFHSPHVQPNWFATQSAVSGAKPVACGPVELTVELAAELAAPNTDSPADSS